MKLALAFVLTGWVGVALGAEVDDPPPKVELAESLTACHKMAADKKLRITLKGEVGAQELVAALAPLSCRAIVLGGGAPRTGKVLIDAPDLLTPREAIDILVAALDSLGLSLEEAGAAMRVVDSARGKEIATQSAHGRQEFVLRVVHLQDASTDEVANTVGKLRSKDGEVLPLPQSRSILIVDRLAQVERMEALVRAIDRPALPSHMFVLPTHRQKPSELADALEKVALLQVPRPEKEAARPQLIPVDSARVILFAGSELAFRRVESLLDRIDPPLLPGEAHAGRIAVYYLKHANAEDLVTVLKDVLGQAKSQSGRTNTTTPGSTPAMSVAPVSGAIDGDVKLTASKDDNAIVATGSASDLESVRELVAQLDMPRRQVYVEAVVLDVSANLSRALGIAFSQTGQPTSNSGALVSSSSSSVSTINTTTLASALGTGGLLAGILGNNVTIAGQSIPSFGVVLSALEQQTDTSVLSRPHLLTLDHQKATISVGQKIPFPTNSLTGVAATSTGLATSTSYTREDVALTFDLTPHLSDDEDIRLEINGEISDVADTTTTSGGGPTTNQRKLKTTVVIKDGDTIVLGGLQKDGYSESVEKVPYLGDIPLLGKLFQTKKKSRVKQDLLIVLTPYIIRDQSDLRRIYERKERERREISDRASMFGDPSSYDPHVDYTRKRGLLEEINRAARQAEDEARALEEARRSLGRVRPIVPGEVVPRP